MDMISICKSSNIPIPTNLRLVYDLEPIRNRLVRQTRDEWKEAAS